METVCTVSIDLITSNSLVLKRTENLRKEDDQSCCKSRYYYFTILLRCQQGRIHLQYHQSKIVRNPSSRARARNHCVLRNNPDFLTFSEFCVKSKLAGQGVDGYFVGRRLLGLARVRSGSLEEQNLSCRQILIGIWFSKCENEETHTIVFNYSFLPTTRTFFTVNR